MPHRQAGAGLASSARGTPSFPTGGCSWPAATSATTTGSRRHLYNPASHAGRRRRRWPRAVVPDRPPSCPTARSSSWPARTRTGSTSPFPSCGTAARGGASPARALQLPTLPENVRGAERQGLLCGGGRALRVPEHCGERELGVRGTTPVRPTRDYGAAVMYLPGKILYAGGGRTTPTAETIDLNQSRRPSGRWTGSMAYHRRHLNATMLPTGEVLVTGGSSGTSFNEPSLAVRVAEIWNPNSGAWTQVASNSGQPHLSLDHAAAAGRTGAACGERRRQDSQRHAGAQREERRVLLAALPVQGRAADDHERSELGRLQIVVPGAHARAGWHQQSEPDRHRLGHPRVRLHPAVHVARLQAGQRAGSP